MEWQTRVTIHPFRAVCACNSLQSATPNIMQHSMAERRASSCLVRPSHPAPKRTEAAAPQQHQFAVWGLIQHKPGGRDEPGGRLPLQLLQLAASSALSSGLPSLPLMLASREAAALRETVRPVLDGDGQLGPELGLPLPTRRLGPPANGLKGVCKGGYRGRSLARCPVGHCPGWPCRQAGIWDPAASRSAESSLLRCSTH